MRKWLIVLCAVCLLLTACGAQSRELIDMESVIVNDYRGVVWEDRTYLPFCVAAKTDRGAQIGYVDGDTDERISEYKGHSPEEWLLSWLPMDGGAMLLKEQSVTDVPEGLEAEYDPYL